MKNKSDNNNTKYKFIKGIVFFVAFITIENLTLLAQTEKPNIVFILADDLGYGDLGCYGQQKFKTPHIDKLALDGMRFTQHYSGAPVCAPSRSALLTGLHTGHTPIRGNKEVLPEGQWPLPQKTETLMSMLKLAGYTTGTFGKWGLGYPGSEGAPEFQGVDFFYGYNCQRLAHNYFPEHLWNNHQKQFLQANSGTSKKDYAPEKIHLKALEFLENNKDTSFFLFYPMVIPHAELVAPEKYMAGYRNKFLPEKNFAGVDSGDQFRKGGYASQPESHAAFAAMINIMDDQVGEIISKINDLNLEENTIIIFSSDNGPHQEGGADPDYFDSNGILRGYKRDLFEGGIRVPFIVSWKKHIKPASITDHISAFWDVMPTLADLIGLKLDTKTDGITFLPTLMGRPNHQKQHDQLYWEFHELNGRRALRQGDWKLIQYHVSNNPAGNFELYNLKDDPSEQNDLASRFPDKVERLKTIMLAERVPSDTFKFASEINPGGSTK